MTNEQIALKLAQFNEFEEYQTQDRAILAALNAAEAPLLARIAELDSECKRQYDEKVSLMVKNGALQSELDAALGPRELHRQKDPTHEPL